MLQLKGPELHWVSSVMHSIGTALCSADAHGPASSPLRVAAQAAAARAALIQDPVILPASVEGDNLVTLCHYREDQSCGLKRSCALQASTMHALREAVGSYEALLACHLRREDRTAVDMVSSCNKLLVTPLPLPP